MIAVEVTADTLPVTESGVSAAVFDSAPGLLPDGDSPSHPGLVADDELGEWSEVEEECLLPVDEADDSELDPVVLLVVEEDVDMLAGSSHG